MPPSPEVRARGKSVTISAIVFAIVVVICIIILVRARSRCARALTGVWVGGTAFLAQAGLRDLTLYVGPEGDSGREGYIVMTDSQGGFLANCAFTAECRCRLSCGRKDEVTIPATFDWGKDAEGFPIPAEVELRLSLAAGSLTLTDGEEKVYAFLYRDCAASDAARAALEADETDDPT